MTGDTAAVELNLATELYQYKNLQSLSLEAKRSTCCFNVPLPQFQLGLRCFPNLKKLTLINITAFDDAMMQIIIQTCHKLTHLEIFNADKVSFFFFKDLRPCLNS